MKTVKQIGVAGFAAAALLFALQRAAVGAGADPVVTAWIGTEFTITSSALEDHVPPQARITLVFDAREGVYRACTRPGPDQAAGWREDWARPCAVTFQLIKSQRYCTLEEVSAGDGETLSSCHRLRSRDVAMHPGATPGSVELHDTIIFPLQAATGSSSLGIAMLIDSPARMTHGGVIHGEAEY
jgi:hypothetical protein